MMNRGLEAVFTYFAFFQYAPTLDQIHTFYPNTISRSRLQALLNKEISRTNLVVGHGRYARRSQKRYVSASIKRANRAAKKSGIVKNYVRILSLVFCIQMVALSGSVAVGSAKKHDDIDLFLVTKSGYVWTSRFIAVLLAYVMGLKRKRGVIRAPDKVCLNLFFDETDLVLPKYKRNLYTAHEVLQAVPVINKSSTYERFIVSNNWVLSFFPNAQVLKKQSKKKLVRAGVVETILRYMQLWIMNPHRTTEIITDTQLWFLPRDMEKILGRRL